MVNKKNKSFEDKNWYEEPVKKWFAIITGFIFIAGLGYSFARIQLNLEFRMEKFEMKQKFNEQLQNQINDCREAKQLQQNQRVEAIEELVENLENN